MRILAWSDLHVDSPENWECVAALSSDKYGKDILILAGDVSHRIEQVERSLGTLKSVFHDVCYVPGNHELWTLDGRHDDSIQRFGDLLDLCRTLDIRTSPTTYGHRPNTIRIVPLYSWYTRPGEGPDTLFRPKPEEAAVEDVWADDHFVQWPPLDGITPTEYFLGLNDLSPSPQVPTITFSHFLPRSDLIFPVPNRAVKDTTRFNFSRVAGSTKIERQLRILGARIHVYGHQHRDRFRLYDGTWYVSRCLGYPQERESDNPTGTTPVTLWENGRFQQIAD